MQLYAGKRQQIGAQLYPSSTTDLTISKTLSTFSKYRLFNRLLCILKKQLYYENRWLKKLWDWSLLNKPHHEKSCFCTFQNKGADNLCGDQLISIFIFNLDTVQFLFWLNLNFKHIAIFCVCTVLFMSEHAVNQVHRLSRNVAEFGRLYHNIFRLI